MNTAGSSDNELPDRLRSLWNQLLAKLTPGTMVQKWSVVKGFTGQRFTIVAIAPKRLEIVRHGGTDGPLTKGEFEKVALRWWPQYRAGVVPRKRLQSESKNLTYIFSLLKWLEDALEVGHA